MKDYLSKWNIQRIIQLVIGIFFLSSFFQEGRTMGLVFGSFMMGQALLNVGCFSSKGCSTSPFSFGSKEAISGDLEVEYEEFR